jgi:hypothetical protein
MDKPSTVTITQAQAKRAQLEREITALLCEFETTTGSRVSRVDAVHVRDSTIEGDRERILTGVRLTVEL